jgi:hypothetical protein
MRVNVEVLYAKGGQAAKRGVIAHWEAIAIFNHFGSNLVKIQQHLGNKSAFMSWPSGHARPRRAPHAPFAALPAGYS